MQSLSFLGTRWRLSDLLDLETLLAQGEGAVRERDRRVFAEEIGPRIADLSEARRRRVGLRLWLSQRRQRGDRDWPSEGWHGVMGLARWILFIGMMILGALLVWGLCLGGDQRVHVVIFVGLTLIVPWLGFLVLLCLRFVATRRARSPWLIRVLLRGLSRRRPEAGQRWRAAFSDTKAARRAVAARASALSQWSGLGYVVGAVGAFVVALLVFDVRFYWEATPDDDVLIHGAVAWLSSPWAALWPGAVPSDAAIQASRLMGGSGATPPGGAVAGAWWRFLLMALLVWGVVPRLVLLVWFALRERMALAGLDFQAPRHRRVWRELAGVSRGAVAEAHADGALVLDVGGHGIDGEAVRGFMLRRLRLNPTATERVSVLDNDAEAAADAALAAHPPHVVLIAADWMLSPRQTARLHARVRDTVGEAVPMVWLVVADEAGTPSAPDDEHLARWTTFIDGLRDPATEITAYDPTV
ncbi:DUF2868 domain-containing protein [Salinisphaera sp. Q1T1-3]|uniref:DUF2868 domain-containing protein n=1 Tax=Salinisphaera sp. Q1T1-3 TaxID=2321229 RepID=UPI001314F1CC|nr:DUF2868 domain-containing protein [Salinisphaera sp. Q1T1-3]